MGFSIWAYGVTDSSNRDFTYSKKNCIDKGDFDPPAILSVIPNSPTAIGVIEKGLRLTVAPTVGKVTVDAAFSVANAQMVHLVDLAMNMLIMRSPKGSIHIFCHKKGIIVDNSSFVNYKLTTRSTGGNFLRALIPTLEKAELCNFGVLFEIERVLSGFAQKKLKGKFGLRIEIRG